MDTQGCMPLWCANALHITTLEDAWQENERRFCLFIAKTS